MKKLFIILIFTSLASFSFSQTANEKILKDLVIVKDGKYTATRFVKATLGVGQIALSCIFD
jgi:hypothetical protein